MNTVDKLPALIGTAGTAATFSLAQWNDAVGLIAGLLTVAYLVRQHLRMNRERRHRGPLHFPDDSK